MKETIGPYQILREIGRGGMGVVYLAHDTRLDRQVAIKALPELLASDPGRLERFEREAKTLATLNHPNLAGIYGVEEQDGSRYLILEYVEGETLADRLDHGPLQVDEAIELAVQIAAGVEAAHDAGVVHRDLKPANIVITPDGIAKVLDFGLARVEEGGSSSGTLDAETLSIQRARHSPTIEGAILGTAAYMSPEQARGRRVDKRTDIWSFGVVLYETLLGASPFVGETASDSIGAVLHKEFSIDQLAKDTPSSVRLVLQRCLQRDKNLRYRDIGDARLDLLNPAVQSVEHEQHRIVLPWAIAVVAILLCVATFTIGMMRARSPSPMALPRVEFEIDVPLASVQFSSISSVAITDDGQSIAVQADNNGLDPIFVRHLNQDTLRRVETPWAEEPELIRWTRDGRWLIVRKDSIASGELWKVSPFGEAPKLISSLPNKGFVWADSVDYIDNDTLIVGLAPAGLWTVPERGGRLKQYIEPAENEFLVQPRPVPGSDALIFLEIHGGTLEMLKDGERSTLFDVQGDRLSQLEIAPDGTVLISILSGTYSRGTYKLNLDLDLDTLTVTGDPLLIYPIGDVDIADNGTLVVGSRLVSDPRMRDLAWINPDGSLSEIVAKGLTNASYASLSPDSRRVATSLVSSASLGQDELEYDIAVIDLSNGSRYELRDPTGNDYYPFWTQGGDELIYTTYTAGIRRSHQRPASGAGNPKIIIERSLITRPSDDGQYLLSSIDQFYYTKKGESEPLVFTESPSYHFDLSSQSAYLAYTPGESGDGILLQRFPEGGALSTVTTMDAWGLSWSQDDSKLYFWAEDAFWETQVDISGLQPSVGQPKQLFSAEDSGVAPSRIYGIGDDGRFLMLLEPDDLPEKTESMPIRIIQGWMGGRTQSR